MTGKLFAAVSLFSLVLTVACGGGGTTGSSNISSSSSGSGGAGSGTGSGSNPSPTAKTIAHGIYEATNSSTSSSVTVMPETLLIGDSGGSMNFSMVLPGYNLIYGWMTLGSNGTTVTATGSWFKPNGTVTTDINWTATLDNGRMYGATAAGPFDVTFSNLGTIDMSQKQGVYLSTVNSQAAYISYANSSSKRFFGSADLFNFFGYSQSSSGAIAMVSFTSLDAAQAAEAGFSNCTPSRLNVDYIPACTSYAYTGSVTSEGTVLQGGIGDGNWGTSGFGAINREGNLVLVLPPSGVSMQLPWAGVLIPVHQ